MTNRKRLNNIVDQAVEASFKKGKLDGQVVNRLVKNFKDMQLADAIYALSRYAKSLKRVLAWRTMVVESVMPIPSSELDKIKSKISRLFTVSKTQVTINPSLLGGIRITVGDMVLDYSVRNKLNQLKENIING